MALWPFLILQCVSSIGMAQGRLLLIELMMPPPEPPIVEPLIGPIVEPEYEWSPEIRSKDPDYIAIPDSMKIPDEIPEEVPEPATDDDETSSVEVEYELTPPEGEKEDIGEPEMELDSLENYKNLYDGRTDEEEEPEDDKEMGRRRGRLQRRKYRTLTGERAIWKIASVFIVGLPYGARNVISCTRHMIQHFLAFRDSPTIPLRRSPKALESFRDIWISLV